MDDDEEAEKLAHVKSEADPLSSELALDEDAGGVSDVIIISSSSDSIQKASQTSFGSRWSSAGTEHQAENGSSAGA